MEDSIIQNFGSVKNCAAELEKALHALVYLINSENVTDNELEAMKSMALLQELMNEKA